jgi:hypothetical protein
LPADIKKNLTREKFIKNLGNRFNSRRFPCVGTTEHQPGFNIAALGTIEGMYDTETFSL